MPTGIVVDAAATVYFVHSTRNQVWKLPHGGDPALLAQGSRERRVVPGLPVRWPDSHHRRWRWEYQDGPVAQARMENLRGSSRVWRGDGGPALQADFGGPSRVAVGPEGTLYVLDHHRDRPRERALAALD